LASSIFDALISSLVAASLVAASLVEDHPFSFGPTLEFIAGMLLLCFADVSFEEATPSRRWRALLSRAGRRALL
jgi:hypothetical protein